MKYQSFLLSADNNNLNKDNSDFLNEKFENGWEYVDSITQSVSAGGNYSFSKKGAVIVILRKNNEVTL